MISAEQARIIMLEHVATTAVVERTLLEADAHGVAVDVRAPHDHPLFAMSAVDGYAIAHRDGPVARYVRATLAAGDVMSDELRPGECARIFTGAMMPAGSDTVVMQEFTTERDGVMTHGDARLKRGGNVRLQGEQFRRGDVLLRAGSLLDIPSIGLLATAGVQQVCVHERPTVAIVRTGSEFADPARPVAGRIFSSNEAMLAAALKRENIPTAHRILMPPDDRTELHRALSLALDHSEVVITTGGVSVGEHDLVRGVLEELGCSILFHGVRQKPGKPMLFARNGRKVVFGLPGNPRAVLVAWHLYVRPYLRAMQGMTDAAPRMERLPLAQAIRWKEGRTEFRAALVREGSVWLLPDEGSHMLVGMTTAEVLAELPADRSELPQRAAVTVHHLPRP